MKQYLKSVFNFSILLIAVLSIYIYIVSEKVPTHFKYQRIAELKTSELIITGSSHALMGINPNRLLQRSSNIAEINKPIVVDLSIIKTYRKSLPALKYVILPIDYFTLFFSGETEHYNKRYWHHWGIHKEGISKWHVNDCYLETPFDLFAEKKEPLSNHSIQSGKWSKFSDKIKDKLASNRIDIWHKTWMDFHAKDSIAKAIEDFIVFCQNEGIQVILIEMPVPKVTQSYMKAEYLNFTSDFIKEVKQKYSVMHIDFKQYEALQSDTLFADADHLNKQGAERLTDSLKQSLMSLTQARN